jgi:hypothetical protein
MAPLGSLGLYFAPGARENADGWPEALFRYRSEPDAPVSAHGLAMARLTLVAGDTELAVSGTLAHRYGESSRVEPGLGASFLKTVDNLTSFHGEVFASRGWDRREAREECVVSEEATRACLNEGPSPLGRPYADSSAPTARFVVGGRRSFVADEFLVIEWYHDAAGESQREFERLVALNARLRRLARRGDASASGRNFGRAQREVEAALGDGRAFRLRAKNYLLASIEDVPFAEGLLVGASAALSLRDNSGLLGPRLVFPAGPARFEVMGRFPYALHAKKGARDPYGGRVAESEALTYRYLIEARARFQF